MRRKKSKNRNDFFTIKVCDWRCSYSMHLNLGRTRHGMNNEVYEGQVIRMKGEIEGSDKYAGSEIVINLYGDRWLGKCLEDEAQGKMHKIGGLGFIVIKKGQKECSLFIPTDAFPVVTSTLLAGKEKYIQVTSEGLYYGSAKVVGFSLDSEREEEEF